MFTITTNISNIQSQWSYFEAEKKDYQSYDHKKQMLFTDMSASVSTLFVADLPCKDGIG